MLLGLSTQSRSTIARYRRGEPLADSADLLARAGHLLGIHKALRILFPHDRDLAYRWVSTPNRRFGDDAARSDEAARLRGDPRRAALSGLRARPLACSKQLVRQVADFRGDLVRNIKGIRVSQDLFDDLAHGRRPTAPSPSPPKRRPHCRAPRR